MSRIVDRPITATVGPDGQGGLGPIGFVYEKERHQVTEVLDEWKMFEGPWWEDPKAVGRAPEQETWWRVRTSKGGIWELIQSPDGRRWKAYRILD